jgi:molybdopterin converting factor small subunit
LAVTLILPSLLAREGGGQSRFELEAETVREALEQLPVRDLLFDERGELRTLVNVFVDGQDMRAMDGVATPLEGRETVRVVAAIAGG